MSDSVNEPSRLDKCGWSSFRPELFIDEPGRKYRDLGGDFIRLLKDYCNGIHVLELCCGTGKLVIQLAREGYEVVGLDLSQEMIEICRQTVGKEDKSVQEKIRIVYGDMCSFDLGQAFDFIILEDDGFVYLLSKEDQISCLTRIKLHLSAGGLFFLNFPTPDLELASSRIYEYDPIFQIKTEPCQWTVIDEYGNQTTVKEGFERRKLTYPCELELLLRTAGLETIHRWGDLKRNPFVDPSRQEYHYLIRKMGS